MPAEAPIFVVFGDFERAPKKDHFPKTDSCNKNAPFLYLPNTNSLSLFSKNAIFLTKKDHFLHNHPQNTIFWAFLKVTFSIFSSFLFGLSNIIKIKTQNAFFVLAESLFWHPDKLPNQYFRTPTHYFCFSKTPQKKTYNWRKTSKNKSWIDFQLNLGQSFSSKTPNLGQIFNSTAYIYIYMTLDWYGM